MCGIRAPLCAMCVRVVQALKSTVGVTSKLHLKKLIQVCLWQCVFISRGVCVSLCVVETVMAVHSPCHALSHVVLFVVAFCFSFVSQRIEGLKDHQEALEARIAHRKAKKEAKVQAAYVVMWCGWLCMGSVCTDAYGTAVGLLRACLCLYHALLVPVLSWVVSCPVLLYLPPQQEAQSRGAQEPHGRCCGSPASTSHRPHLPHKHNHACICHSRRYRGRCSSIRSRSRGQASHPSPTFAIPHHRARLPATILCLATSAEPHTTAACHNHRSCDWWCGSVPASAGTHCVFVAPSATHFPHAPRPHATAAATPGCPTGVIHPSVPRDGCTGWCLDVDRRLDDDRRSATGALAAAGSATRSGAAAPAEASARHPGSHAGAVTTASFGRPQQAQPPAAAAVAWRPAHRAALRDRQGCRRWWWWC